MHWQPYVSLVTRNPEGKCPPYQNTDQSKRVQNLQKYTGSHKFFPTLYESQLSGPDLSRQTCTHTMYLYMSVYVPHCDRGTSDECLRLRFFHTFGRPRKGKVIRYVT